MEICLDVADLDQFFWCDDKLFSSVSFDYATCSIPLETDMLLLLLVSNDAPVIQVFLKMNISTLLFHVLLLSQDA